MNTHTTRRRPTRVHRAGGAALAATGAVAAFAQMTAGGGAVATADTGTTGVSDDGVPTNASLTGDATAVPVEAPAEQGGTPTGDVPVVTGNDDAGAPTNGSIVGPPGVDDGPAPDTGASPSAPTAGPVADTGDEEAPTPVVEPEIPDQPTQAAPVVGDPVTTPPVSTTGDDPAEGTVDTTPVVAAPVEEPVITPAVQASAPQTVSTNASNNVSLGQGASVNVDTEYQTGPNLASSDSDVSVDGVPGQVNVQSTYDDGTRSGSVDVSGAPIQASGTATPVDGGSYPDGGGVYDTTGSGNIGGVEVGYTGTVNGNDNSTSGSVSVDLPAGGPSVTVPVNTPSIPGDASQIPSPQTIVNGIQGMLGGR